MLIDLSYPSSIKILGIDPKSKILRLSAHNEVENPKSKIDDCNTEVIVIQFFRVFQYVAVITDN
ncbi:MAG: hypothetical protein C6Y22_00090 [Hapalosiphonaceae cyanobacterium JJU2]|nr:MAG: hypothetical protein C6Y22_00090 [Hapalosiphonaceae cyanobacterium JJU2]